MLKFKTAMRAFGLRFIETIKNFFRAIINYFKNFIDGNAGTKTSYFIMGYSSIAKKQFARGFLTFAVQAVFIIFMALFGGGMLKDFITLGIKKSGFDDITGYFVEGDNALLMLLFGVFTIAVIMFFLLFYFKSVAYAVKLQDMKEPPKFKDEIKTLLNEKFHITMLFFPVMSIIVFIIIPLVFMILLSGTNYNSLNPDTPKNFFNWNGLESFRLLFSSNSNISKTFAGLLSWTFIWAFFATFLNYFLGIGLALLINTKGLRGKPFFRFCFIVTIAVPQFVSLFVLRTFLSDTGVVNNILMDAGIIEKHIPFLTEGMYAKITVIVANLWVGIPFTMLITNGILINIPEELYEAASIDGCSAIKMFLRITMPYVLFITSPYLITQFVGNLNNFNVIYLLNSGGPTNADYYSAGHTDLLITWLYKLTKNKNDYSIASAIGILIFVISAVFSLAFYRRSAAYKKEGDFS